MDNRTAVNLVIVASSLLRQVIDLIIEVESATGLEVLSAGELDELKDRVLCRRDNLQEV
jgi:hypothetical protein